MRAGHAHVGELSRHSRLFFLRGARVVLQKLLEFLAYMRAVAPRRIKASGTVVVVKEVFSGFRVCV